ncbi:MAG: Slp family lipoprotein [Thiotrichales bacterium]
MVTAARYLLVLGLSLLLAACAAGPQFKVEPETKDLTPREAAQDAARYTGLQIVWGGVILEAENLEDSTRLVVLGYPLDRYQAPRLSQEATGRFVVEIKGYLETADYAPQRRLTVAGQIRGMETAKVGEADYRYPVVQADQYYLWPRGESALNQPAVRFGIGINISN